MQSWWFSRAYLYQGPGRWSHVDRMYQGEQYAATDQLSTYLGRGYQPVYTWQWVNGAWIDRSRDLGLPYLPEVALGYQRGLVREQLPPNPTPPAPPGASWSTAGRVLLAAAGVVALVWGASRRAGAERARRENDRYRRVGA